MAKSLFRSTSLLALLLLFLIVAASEMRVAEAKYCGKQSGKWSGPCLQNNKCSQHCKHFFPKAKYGVCDKKAWGKGWKYFCICYYDC